MRGKAGIRVNSIRIHYQPNIADFTRLVVTEFVANEFFAYMKVSDSRQKRLHLLIAGKLSTETTQVPFTCFDPPKNLKFAG